MRCGDSKNSSVAGTCASSARRQAGADERGERRGGTGNGHDAVAGGDGEQRQPVTRIGDERRAGIGDQRHGLAGVQRGDEPRPRLVRIVFVIGIGPVDDAVAVEQHAGHARVLAGEHIGAGQRFERPQRDIGEIADGRRDQVERRLQRPGRDDGIVQAKRLSALARPACRHVFPHHLPPFFCLLMGERKGPGKGQPLRNTPSTPLALAILPELLPFCASTSSGAGRDFKAMPRRLPAC
jgi:hypothetical protein